MSLRTLRASLVAVGVSMTFLAPVLSQAQLAQDPDFLTQMGRLERGANGFTGPLTLSRDTIPVVPMPVAYEGASTTYASTFSTTVQLRGSVRREGANLVHEQSVIDERVSPTVPAVTVRIVANAQGQESKHDFVFPAYDRAPQDGQTRAMMSMFGRMADGFIADSTRPHTYTLGQPWQTQADITKMVMTSLPPGLEVKSNTVAEKIEGLTRHEGRRAVLLTNSGTMELVAAGATLAMTLRGYRIVDLETGLELEALQGLTSANVVGGRAQPASSTVTHTVRTIRAN